jgi:hypothetical protein
VTLAPKASDNTRRLALIGPCRMGWHEGVHKAIEAHFPGATRPAAASADRTGDDK